MRWSSTVANHLSSSFNRASPYQSLTRHHWMLLGKEDKRPFGSTCIEPGSFEMTTLVDWRSALGRCKREIEDEILPQ